MNTLEALKAIKEAHRLASPGGDVERAAQDIAKAIAAMRKQLSAMNDGWQPESASLLAEFMASRSHELADAKIAFDKAIEAYHKEMTGIMEAWRA